MTKILCIEDEDHFRQDMCMMLQDEGFTAISAADGEQGLRMIDSEHPDLILCDVKVPKISGYDILRHIRENKENNEYIPFIFLTGADDKRSIIEGTKLLADDYIVKPSSFELLVTKINSTIERVRLINDNTPKGQLNRIKQINRSLMDIVKIVELIKIREAGKKSKAAIAALIDQVVIKALNITSLTEALTERKVNINQSEYDFIPVIKILEATTAAVKKQDGNLRKQIVLNISTKTPLVTLDQKYFCKALEDILFEIVSKSTEKQSTSIISYLNGDGGITLKIFNSSLTKTRALKISQLQTPATIFQMQGIKLLPDHKSVNICIPAYRVES